MAFVSSRSAFGAFGGGCGGGGGGGGGGGNVGAVRGLSAAAIQGAASSSSSAATKAGSTAEPTRILTPDAATPSAGDSRGAARPLAASGGARRAVGTLMACAAHDGEGSRTGTGRPSGRKREPQAPPGWRGVFCVGGTGRPPLMSSGSCDGLVLGGRVRSCLRRLIRRSDSAADDSELCPSERSLGGARAVVSVCAAWSTTSTAADSCVGCGGGDGSGDGDGGPDGSRREGMGGTLARALERRPAATCAGGALLAAQPMLWRGSAWLFKKNSPQSSANPDHEKSQGP